MTQVTGTTESLCVLHVWEQTVIFLWTTRQYRKEAIGISTGTKFTLYMP